MFLIFQIPHYLKTTVDALIILIFVNVFNVSHNMHKHKQK